MRVWLASHPDDIGRAGRTALEASLRVAWSGGARMLAVGEHPLSSTPLHAAIAEESETARAPRALRPSSYLPYRSPQLLGAASASVLHDHPGPNVAIRVYKCRRLRHVLCHEHAHT